MKGIEVWRKSSKSAVKWSEVKCIDVRWSGAVGNLNGVKQNERVVKRSWVKFKREEVKCRKCSEVEWSVVCVVKVLVKGRLTLLEDMKFAAYMAFSFITFFHILLVPFL